MESFRNFKMPTTNKSCQYRTIPYSIGLIFVALMAVASCGFSKAAKDQESEFVLEVGPNRGNEDLAFGLGGVRVRSEKKTYRNGRTTCYIEVVGVKFSQDEATAFLEFAREVESKKDTLFLTAPSESTHVYWNKVSTEGVEISFAYNYVTKKWNCNFGEDGLIKTFELALDDMNKLKNSKPAVPW